MPRVQKTGNKSFDLAVLIDSTKQYNKILCGPILYELKPRYLHFTSAKKYVTGDINIVNKAANFVQEIDSKTYIKGFLRNSCDITNSFKNVITVRLFKFKDNQQQIWTNHLNQQQHTHADVLVIVNDKNHPIYVLHNTDINFVNQSIKYETCKEYQKNDVQILNLYANKIKTFLLHKKWKIPLTKDADKIFKNAICYNFNDEEDKNSFFKQEYGVALVTNDENQVECLLTGIEYMYNDNTIIFNSIIPYKKGYYPKLKEFGEQIKSLSINEYKKCDSDIEYKFKKDFIKNKCMLFNINDIDGWLEFISMKTIEIYDIGVITNNDEYQAYFLNKTIINWMEKMISFGSIEKFAPKHHGIINKFAKLVRKCNLKDFTIQNFEYDDTAINEIYFYQWDLHKETPDNSENEQEEEEEHKIQMQDMKKQKSVDSINLKKKNKQIKIQMQDMKKQKSIDSVNLKKKKKRKKKKDKMNKKSRKTQSEMPYANAGHSYKIKDRTDEKDSKNKKDKKDKKDKYKIKYKHNGKTRSEIQPKRRVNNKEKHRRKDSVIRPSIAKKISIINVKTKHNKNNSSELSIIHSEINQMENINNISDNIICQKEPKSEIKIHSELGNNIIKEQKECEIKKHSVNSNVDKECIKMIHSNEETSVWDLYVNRFGMAPKNSYQLQNFTKTNDNIKSLSYKEVRQIFAERAK